MLAILGGNPIILDFCPPFWGLAPLSMSCGSLLHQNSPERIVFLSYSVGSWNHHWSIIIHVFFLTSTVSWSESKLVIFTASMVSLLVCVLACASVSFQGQCRAGHPELA